MKTACLISAKGDSKRLPRKNVAMCAGKKLIEWPLIAANKTKFIDKIFVSTDDQEIAEISEKHGAEIIWRPWQLVVEEAPTASAVYHAYRRIFRNHEYDFLTFVFAVAPCIQYEDLDGAYDMLVENKRALEISGVHKLEKPQHLNNYWVMTSSNALVSLFPPAPNGVNPYVTVNAAEVYFGQGGFNIQRIDYGIYEDMPILPEITDDMDAETACYDYETAFMKYENRRRIIPKDVTCGLMLDLKLGYEVSEYSGIDINYMEDLKMAEAILRFRGKA